MIQVGPNKINPTTMFFDSAPIIGIHTGAGDNAGHLEDFRWETHLPLPYPFPQKAMIDELFAVGSRTYRAQIGGACNRVFATLQAKTGGPKVPQILLEDATRPPTPIHNAIHIVREPLQSVAVFNEQTSYPDDKAAFADANVKIQECIDWLAGFVNSYRRAAPYLATWLIYPVMQFDIGTLYHNVTAFNKDHGHRCARFSGMSVSGGKNLQQPIFVMDPPSTAPNPPFDTANELLAESLMAHFRGLYRLTVLNAYAAVESLANSMFLKYRIAELVADGLNANKAEETAEKERQHIKLDFVYLFHKGIMELTTRSLCKEKKTVYDELQKVQNLRHRVAHSGFKPEKEPAKNAHKLCCEVVQWFADLAGVTVPPLYPDPKNVNMSLKWIAKGGEADAQMKMELFKELFTRPVNEPTPPTDPHADNKFEPPPPPNTQPHGNAPPPIHDPETPHGSPGDAPQGS